MPATRTPLRRTAVASLGLAALLLTACSGGADAGSTGTAESTATVSGEGLPVTVDHAFGSTTVESADRVVATSWTNQDVALALGVTPVGFTRASYGDEDGDGLLAWTKQALDASGAATPILFDETDGVPFESISDLRPTVILSAYSGITRQDYDTLSQIAPTIAYPGLAWGTTWQDSATLDGAALGLKNEAVAKVNEVESAITQTTASHPQLAGTTFLYGWYDPTDASTFTYYTPNDARVKFVEDLGLDVAPSITKLSGNSETFSGTISSENADQLDADVLVVYGDDTTLAALQADPLLSKIPAVARGSVYVLKDGSSAAMATSSPNLLSIPWVLEEYTAGLAAAADKVS
ncbi:iron-siderophore ABC transporter substrate-binding protein [Rathayibacter rathayi]|uniref:iron-siderophore ABC transporter substrate-binding protein n=2 Tax=Rathayibacter rathayi TaxID=33887 RepID=UPI000CE8343F|nr:iron-siderophore ABC transporter substrate-binding protein [Rathayibacter rathayi]PPG65846.1 ABC transporter substrate-binding protein [Rathayibacter rathayi]PPG75231.1 ABC transporter substrate-binding protein [Rathayibacter rathayi]PPG96947.1 ABC transporter substrate-binding protein [Rathayibacter rathayi]PPI75946.1 ABC transporter substrate-binding protein [Rathayibacter rathayi]